MNELNFNLSNTNTIWTTEGVVNGTQKIVGLGKFEPDLGILATFLPSLGGSFFLVWFRNRSSLGLRFSNKGLGISASLEFYHSPPLRDGLLHKYKILSMNDISIVFN